MHYRADVSEPDPSPIILSKYLSEPGPSGPDGFRRARVGYPSTTPHYHTSSLEHVTYNMSCTSRWKSKNRKKGTLNQIRAVKI